MRVTVNLEASSNLVIPINYQHALQGLIYQALGAGDSQFSSWLHSEGYSLNNSSQKKFKLFCFSSIRFHTKYVLDENKENFILKGSGQFSAKLSFSISCPKEEIAEHLINGLFRTGSQIDLANNTLVIKSLETHEMPDFSLSEAVFKPNFAPIVARQNNEQKRFLTHEEKDEMEELLKKNLINKIRLLSPESERFEGIENFELKLLPCLLRDDRPKTKLILFKVRSPEGKLEVINIKGTLAPIWLKASPAVLGIAHDCGFGEKNSSGFGFVEVLKM